MSFNFNFGVVRLNSTQRHLLKQAPVSASQPRHVSKGSVPLGGRDGTAGQRRDAWHTGRLGRREIPVRKTGA